MPTGIIEKPATALKNYIVIDDIVVYSLPDCPKCGHNQWHVSGNGIYLICVCGAKYFNRNRV